VTVRENRETVRVHLPADGRTAQIAAAVDRLVAWLARHWLAAFNAAVAIFVGLPFLAPTLMHLGTAGHCSLCADAGRLIYTVYTPTCHQLPERSFFLFGPQAVYQVGELEARGALPPGLNVLQRQGLRFAGSPAIGYKVAFCQRDVAIYAGILASGLLFGLIRRPWLRAGRSLPKLPLWAYALFLVPMAIDGGMQLLGLHESNWLLRTITGGLFGSATVWLAYPYVQDAMDDVTRSSKKPPPGTGQKTSVEV
jgi:uncharacterized membrane protein